MASSTGSPSKLRVVLVGKIGAGKSSLGNTLLGAKQFEVGRGMSLGTVDCKWAEQMRHSVDLEVTDTPGLCDTHWKEKEVYLKVGKSIALTSPGPHIILMVLRCDKRFTQEEYQAYMALKSLFSEEICQHMIIVFNGLDAFYEDDDDETDTETLRDLLKKEVSKLTSACLGDVLRDAGHRYIGISNRARKPDKERQARDLIDKMQALVAQNEGRFYRTELFDNVAKRVDQLIEQRMAKTKASREEAERATKMAIAKNEVDSGFFDVLPRVVSPFVDRAATVIAAGAATVIAAGAATVIAAVLCRTM